MIKITWQVSDLHVVGVGNAEKGKDVNVSANVADSLIEQGLAKLSKKSKIKPSDKKSDKGVE
tara:strand:- start:213 stop:398 length:186 start_codon:yes stop_codon:yes gene_type:complete